MSNRAKSMWRGDWHFVNIRHNLHGSEGSATVLALDEQEAMKEVARNGSKYLFGTDMRRSEMRISNIQRKL